MESKAKVLALACACLLALFSRAAYAEATPGTIGELDDLQQQILIAKKRQELDELRSKGRADSGAAASSAGRAAVASEARLPGVMSVMGGAGKSLMAILDYGNGQTVNVRVGTSIPGGYRVEAIGVEEVVVSRDNDRHRLAVGVPPAPGPAPSPSPPTASPAPMPGTGLMASHPFVN